jgi:nucleotide-binding universal stress UspA family protein
MEKATVGVDGRPASRAALEWAVDRSRHVAMRVDLVAVASTHGVDGEFLDALRHYHEGNLRECAEWAAAATPALHVTTRLLLGHPTEELVHASEGTDLLVVGTDK